MTNRGGILIFLEIVSILFIIVMVVLMIIYHNEDKREINEGIEGIEGKIISLNESINKKFDEMLGDKPIIKFSSIHWGNITGSFLDHICNGGGYSCSLPYYKKIDVNKTYQEQWVSISNRGKKTKNLRISFNCNRLANSESSGVYFLDIYWEYIKIEQNYNWEIVIKIEEIDTITDYAILFFYDGEKDENFSCDVSYSSDDITNEEIILNPGL